MNILLLVIASCISLSVLWIIISKLERKRLEKDTETRKTNIEAMKRELKKKGKRKKKPEQLEPEPDFESEENLESLGYPSSAIQDEEDG